MKNRLYFWCFIFLIHMHIGSKLSKLFDLEKINLLFNKIGVGFEELVAHLLEKNGGEILLRRQINDYFTFNIKDNDNEIVILKSGKESYTINCTCRSFQSNETCQHVAAVLFSLRNQLEAELNKPSGLDNPELLQASSTYRSSSSSAYIIQGAGVVSFQKLSGLYPFINNLNIPKNIVSRKINHGKKFHSVIKTVIVPYLLWSMKTIT
ncbi:MAG: SWIM zinc finger family protein [Saprospiraceae bacterium]|nr:SWIM zinc finger family protein [Saprospiraceae bacterium]